MLDSTPSKQDGVEIDGAIGRPKFMRSPKRGPAISSGRSISFAVFAVAAALAPAPSGAETEPLSLTEVADRVFVRNGRGVHEERRRDRKYRLYCRRGFRHSNRLGREP